MVRSVIAGGQRCISRSHFSINASCFAQASTPAIRPPLDVNDGLQNALQTLHHAKSQAKTSSPTVYHKILKEAIVSAARQDTSLHSDSRQQGRTSAGPFYYDIIIAALSLAQSSQVDLGSHGIIELSKLARLYPHIIPSLLIQSAPYSGYPIDLYDALSRYTSLPRQPEQLIFVVNEMLERKIQPPVALVRNTVRSCCEWGYPRLAHDLVEDLDAASIDGQKVEISSWVNILISSADNQYLDGVQAAWERVANSRSYRPDEGLLLRVLDVASRYGKPDLASAALAGLSSIGARAQEHHLVALLETFVNAGRVPDALRVVSAIGENGMTPSLSVVEPIASVLTNAEIIDQAFYALEDMHKAGERVDVAALNALILASARIGDLRRVRATQGSAGDLGVEPNIDTFNLILEGCIVAQHRPLGDTILSEMSNKGIEPDPTTYDRMIHLCLLPETYEDAFVYLEKMKEKGLKPLASTYLAIMAKCSDNFDRRWKLVEEEMRSLGYRVNGRTKRTVGKTLYVSERRDNTSRTEQ